MSNKLQNVKAIKQMLAGEHKFQTRKTTYFGNSNTEKEKTEVLEKFENGDPKVWIETSPSGHRTKVTKHDGFTSRVPDNSIMEEVRDMLRVPDDCPKCGTNMREKEKMLNFKFYFKRGKCFNCVLTEERQIKEKGEKAWKRYQNKIMKSNAESWFKDCDKEVEILKTQMKETVWENADGERGEIDISKIVKKIDKDYKKLKADIRKSFK
jgi:hypothetical protein|tara:strand:+ start:249 stop:875 length:627 start_codon:yes stop_codon:yes gene_type:complete